MDLAAGSRQHASASASASRWQHAWRRYQRLHPPLGSSLVHGRDRRIPGQPSVARFVGLGDKELVDERPVGFGSAHYFGLPAPKGHRAEWLVVEGVRLGYVTPSRWWRRARCLRAACYASRLPLWGWLSHRVCEPAVGSQQG